MRTLLLALAATACAPAVQAPESAEEMVVFGFDHFDEAGFVEAIVDPLATWSDDHLEQLTEGYAIDALTADDVAAAGIVVEDADIMGAMGHAEYTVDAGKVAWGMTLPDQISMHDDLVTFELLGTDGDLDCFLAKACDRYEYDAHEVAKVPLLGQSDRTFHEQMRWVHLDDGRDVLALRQLSPDPMTFTVELLAVHQQYGFALIFPTDTGARRVEAFWIDAEILGEFTVPEGFMVHQAADAMAGTAQEFEDWLATQD